MKHIRQFCIVSILTFTLAITAFAGNIECGVVTPPPPPQETTIAGDMATGVAATNEASISETAFVDPMTELTLNILQSMMALF